MHIFKVWNVKRTKKAFVTITDEVNLYENLILKASSKLDINGVKLALESDGTEVDEDVLLHVKDLTLILMQQGDTWSDANSQAESSTVTVTSGTSSIETDNSALLCLNERQSNDDHNWATFDIPYAKFPRTLMEALEKGEKNRNLKTEIVHIVVNELRSIKPLIPLKVLRRAAILLVDRHPNSLQDVDEDGNIIGEGYSSMYFKLCERATYLRRPNKRQNSEPMLQSNKIRKKINAMAGCSNWAPSVYQEHCEAASLLNKTTNTEITDDIVELLDKAYPEVRHFLNDVLNPPTVEQIRQKFPMVFNIKGIYWHFKKLTDKSLETLATGLREKSKKLVNYGLKKKLIGAEEVTEMPAERAALITICKQFKENLGVFLKSVKVEDLENFNSFDIMQPCLLQIDSENTKIYHIYFEKSLVASTNDFCEALSAAFGLYYVLNVQYPKHLSLTLEFIQTYFVKIYPDTGKKSAIPNSTKRIINFINNLQD